LPPSDDRGIVRRVLRSIRDWIFTIPFLVLFGLTLLVFDPIARVVRLIGLEPFERVMSFVQRALVAMLRISGTRVEIEAPDGFDFEAPYVVVSNHQGIFDIPLIGTVFAPTHPKYVAKKSLGKWLPSVSLNLRWGGNALIDRSDGIGAVREIARMARTAQERKRSVVIFPEGTRSRDGTLKDFQRSGTQALLRAAGDLPVVPVALDGSWRLLLHNLLPVPFGTHIRVRLGTPIARSRKDGEAVAEQTESWIRATIDEWRAETGRAPRRGA
jgi:1-acyl-sn-glycerol-3-phosphate acyltransferase